MAAALTEGGQNYIKNPGIYSWMLVEPLTLTIKGGVELGGVINGSNQRGAFSCQTGKS